MRKQNPSFNLGRFFLLILKYLELLIEETRHPCRQRCLLGHAQALRDDSLGTGDTVIVVLQFGCEMKKGEYVLGMRIALEGERGKAKGAIECLPFPVSSRTGHTHTHTHSVPADCATEKLTIGPPG